MKKENLIAYAMNFASFLLDEKIAKDIDNVILFGSVARGDFDDESDIDIFIDSKRDIEGEVNKTLSFFNQSEMQKKWELKGVKNDISVKVGELSKWRLKRDVIADGILLYGKFKQLAEDVEYYLILTLSFKQFKQSQKVKLWRKLYGYKQKIGKKVYHSKGLTDKLGAKRLDNCLAIPVKNKKEILDFLNKEKINYSVREIWSDDL